MNESKFVFRKVVFGSSAWDGVEKCVLSFLRVVVLGSFILFFLELFILFVKYLV